MFKPALEEVKCHGTSNELVSSNLLKWKRMKLHHIGLKGVPTSQAAQIHLPGTTHGEISRHGIGPDSISDSSISTCTEDYHPESCDIWAAVHRYVSLNICTCVDTYMYLYIYTCIYTYVCVFMHVCAYIDLNAELHAGRQTDRQPNRHAEVPESFLSRNPLNSGPLACKADASAAPGATKCGTALELRRRFSLTNNSKGPKDHIDTRILHPGSKAQDKGGFQKPCLC